MTEFSNEAETHCGTSDTPQPRYSGFSAPLTRPKNGLGTASLVIAVIALVTDSTVFALAMIWPIFGGLILGTVAVVVGFADLGRVKRGEADTSGFAIAGIVLGSVAIVAGIVVGVLVIIGLAIFAWLASALKN